jgi:hypothetical protein
LSANYPAEVTKLKTMPRSVIGKEGQTIEDLAETLLKARSNITGEKIDAANISAEVARLQERTGLKPGQVTSGRKLDVYNDNDIAALGEKTSYRFLPQIGQLLKLHGGVKEEQIQEAHKHSITADTRKSPANRPNFSGEKVCKPGSDRPSIRSATGRQTMAQRAISFNPRNACCQRQPCTK